MPALGTSVGDLTGVPFEEIPKRSACAKLKWVEQNIGIKVKPMFELDWEHMDSERDWAGSFIGLRVIEPNTGTELGIVKSEATGGDDGDPAGQIAKDIYKIIQIAQEYGQEMAKYQA